MLAPPAGSLSMAQRRTKSSFTPSRDSTNSPSWPRVLATQDQSPRSGGAQTRSNSFQYQPTHPFQCGTSMGALETPRQVVVVFNALFVWSNYLPISYQLASAKRLLAFLTNFHKSNSSLPPNNQTSNRKGVCERLMNVFDRVLKHSRQSVSSLLPD